MRKLDKIEHDGKEMYCYSAQKGLAWKYDLCKMCEKGKKVKKTDMGTKCGKLNTIKQLGKDMNFKAPVFYCQDFKKDELI